MHRTRMGAMNETTRAKALDILEGMRTIANADMLETGSYVSPYVENTRRKGAICRGHKACAIGSLWLAGGIRFEGSDHYGVSLPGVDQAERDDFLKGRHALRAAYNALNDAATDYIDHHDIYDDGAFFAPVEALFESEDRKLDGDERRKAMLKVISAAKRRLKTA